MSDHYIHEEVAAWMKGVSAELNQKENDLCRRLFTLLRELGVNRDPMVYDGAFGMYSQEHLDPCRRHGFASRSALFGAKHLVPQVLRLETELGGQFHKGALFYDVGLAHFIAGDVDGYEYFLALTDEEEFRKTNGTSGRGACNQRTTGLPAQTIKRRIGFAASLLNGGVAGHTANYAFLTGVAPIEPGNLDKWRESLDALHQYELLRTVHDLQVFLGGLYPYYTPAVDNPFVMLRLAKALSHLAQWVESCLTDWQGRAIHGALSRKLLDDTAFDGLHNGSHADKQLFAGNCPQGPDVDTELRQLLVDLVAAPTTALKQRHLLRILYIVRNSTAHTIEPALAMYKDRTFLLNLIQVVFASVFVICQLKGKPMPN